MEEHSDAAPARLADSVSWMLTQTAMYAGRLVAEGLATVGARGYHYRLLASLYEFGPASQAALARRSAVHVSDVVTTIKELVEQGLIERTVNPVDRRRNIITITATGRHRLLLLDQQIAKIQDDLLAPLSADERRRLAQLLSAVREYHARES